MLYYETIEDEQHSDWVVFIHGIGGSTLTWKKQIDDFSKNHNILLLDLAGHGKSRDIKSEHKLSSSADEIKNILDFLHIEKAHFVGMSLGTLILAFYALMYPNTVLSLTMAGAVTKLKVNAQITLKFAQIVKRILPQKLTCNIFAGVLMPRKNHKPSRKIFTREAVKMKKQELMKWIETIEITKHASVYIDLFKTISHIPILYIMGSQDHLFLNGAKETAEIINADFKVIENCGHVCSIEKYKEFNKIALDFIEQKVGLVKQKLPIKK